MLDDREHDTRQTPLFSAKCCSVLPDIVQRNRCYDGANRVIQKRHETGTGFVVKPYYCLGLSMFCIATWTAFVFINKMILFGNIRSLVVITVLFESKEW